ncbi:MAG: 30S ribosomal protein S3 [archaeon]
MTVERFFISEKVKELEVKRFLAARLRRAGYSHTEIKRTPMGTRVIIYATRPGLVIGRSGESIKELTEAFKTNFHIDNPQVEVKQVDNPDVDAQLQAAKIGNLLERGYYFKKVAHRVLDRIMECGARGAEVRISGKVPSARAKDWTFKKGYIRHCGQLVKDHVLVGYYDAQLKPGVVGVRVRIMPQNVIFPDEILIASQISARQAAAAVLAAPVPAERKAEAVN